MDDRGYLVAHRGLIEANDRGPLEEKHITHKAGIIASSILIGINLLFLIKFIHCFTWSTFVIHLGYVL